ncbi:MAG: prefoldin subunit alpha [Nanoarchaeota archaeon]|nr:prefoldin subunit alpha [Nanoarchaeota archaeon]
MDQKEIQQKYLEYQMLDQKIKQIQQQAQLVDQQLIEIMATLQSIDDYDSVKDEPEILVPINNGIFAKATLKKEDKLLVNVGASVIVDKSIKETKELIEKQKKEMEEIKVKITENMDKLVVQASLIEQQISSSISKNNQQ